MNNKKIRAIGALILVVLWLGLTVFAWVKPADKLSLSERRELKQFPVLSGETVLKGEFMTGFESYTLWIMAGSEQGINKKDDPKYK